MFMVPLSYQRVLVDPYKEKGGGLKFVTIPVVMEPYLCHTVIST